uniref:Conserved hypothetical plastid protein n=1 Tax=Boldia erythrosiphon TaxID=74908 RepID=A0A1X9PVE9_9RHOD|nr:conserved hypothetical plastid protein [Boldia erythrosiphon]ARO90683.1 conserved hypothetical plastid protein [Boldia erythrosiphon]
MSFWKQLLDSLQNQQNIETNSMKSIEIKNDKVNGLPLILYLSNNKNINLQDLEKLCNSVGWIKRPFRKIKIAITNSFVLISILCKQNGKIYLIGFARATSDHAFNATIWDVVIHPNFQGIGLGKVLIKEIVNNLKYSKIHTITLFADPQVIRFYKNLGFKANPNKTTGMFWYPK